MKFITIKLKNVLLIFLCLCFGCVALFGIRTSSIKANSKLLGITVVIDAGHGGVDGGAISTNLNLKESDLNLEIALKLQKYLQQAGITVVQTRKDKDGLYSPFAKNKKQSEMQKRKQIIQNSNLDLLVSIHQNSFPLSYVCGAGVYYSQDNVGGEVASKLFAGELEKVEEIEKVVCKSADFYVLNCTQMPGVMVECCYLSNANDEKFISTNSGKEKIAYAIFCGIVKFFGIVNY